MSDQDSILVSIILNMCIDGKCDLESLSPPVADFIKGALEEYYEDEENNEMLYWYAHETLSLTSNRKVH